MGVDHLVADFVQATSLSSRIRQDAGGSKTATGYSVSIPKTDCFQGFFEKSLLRAN
jgi:hypothetical protein